MFAKHATFPEALLILDIEIMCCLLRIMCGQRMSDVMSASDVRHENGVASKSVFCKLLRVRWLAIMPAWRGMHEFELKR